MVHFGPYGKIHNSYEPIQKVCGATWKNGNLVLQYTEIDKLPPKHFYVGNRKVLVIYTYPIPEAFQSLNFKNAKSWADVEVDPSETCEWVGNKEK